MILGVNDGRKQKWYEILKKIHYYIRLTVIIEQLSKLWIWNETFFYCCRWNRRKAGTEDAEQQSTRRVIRSRTRFMDLFIHTYRHVLCVWSNGTQYFATETILLPGDSLVHILDITLGEIQYRYLIPSMGLWLVPTGEFDELILTKWRGTKMLFLLYCSVH